MTHPINSTEVSRLQKMYSLQELKPGLHLDIVITIAEHACDHVLKRVLKLSAYRLQIFLVKDHEDQDIPGKLKKWVRKHVLVILTTHMEIRLSKDAQDICNS